MTAMLLCMPITQAENARDSFAWIFNQCEAELAPNAQAVTQCATDLGIQAAEKRGLKLCEFYGSWGCNLFLTLEGMGSASVRNFVKEGKKMTPADYRLFRNDAADLIDGIETTQRVLQLAEQYFSQQQRGSARTQPRQQYNWSALSDLGRQFQEQAYSQSRPPKMITCSTISGFTNCNY